MLCLEQAIRDHHLTLSCAFTSASCSSSSCAVSLGPCLLAYMSAVHPICKNKSTDHSHVYIYTGKTGTKKLYINCILYLISTTFIIILREKWLVNHLLPSTTPHLVLCIDIRVMLLLLQYVMKSTKVQASPIMRAAC